MKELINIMKNDSCCTPSRQSVRGKNGWNYETLSILFHCLVGYATYQIDISCNALLEHQQLQNMHVSKSSEKLICVKSMKMDVLSMWLIPIFVMF